MTTILERLARATGGSMAYWCVTCGRVYLQPPKHEGSGELLQDGAEECSGAIDIGSPQECIAALKAYQTETVA